MSTIFYTTFTVMKYIFLLYLWIGLICLGSCTFSNDSPGTAAKKYTGYIQSDEYEKFADVIYHDEALSPEQVVLGKRMIVSIMKDRAKETLELKGGILSVGIVDEKISDDGKTAYVRLTYTYGNGEMENAEFHMVKSDGRWKLLLKN